MPLDDMFSTSKTPPKALTQEEKERREKIAGEILRICALPLLCVGTGFRSMALEAARRPRQAFLILASILGGSYLAASQYLHLQAIYYLWPLDLVPWPEAWVSQFSFGAHHLFVTVAMVLLLAFISGARMFLLRGKLQRIFREIGLRNAQEETPKFIQKVPLDQHRVEYLFDPQGTGIKDFQKYEDRLECSLRAHIESIRYAKDYPGAIVVTCNRGGLPAEPSQEDSGGE